MKYLALVLLSLLLGCVDEIDVTLSSDPVLVIQGLVTNETKAHKVQLSKSFSFNQNPVFAVTDPVVLGASVEIIENDELIIPLSELGNGVYLTANDFAGTIGNYYSLRVVLKNGMVYTSKNEELLPNGATINNACFENSFKEVSRGESIVRNREVRFKVSFTDNADTKDYYRWGYKGVFEVIAPLADNPPGCNLDCGPCPIIPVKNCWATSFDVEFLKIENDINYNGMIIEDFMIYATPADRKFDIGYSANIEQFSLTATAYNYWKAISDQLNNNGTIFETPNHQVRGNIVDQSNPKELVLGYFGASAILVTRVFVNEEDVPGFLGPIDCSGGCVPRVCIDCREWLGTDIKPDYWPN